MEYLDNCWKNNHRKEDASSTICSSSQSYGSRDNAATVSSSYNNKQFLRPRGGISLHSLHARHPSYGSCHPPRNKKCNNSQHYRHESLPVSLFLSNVASSDQLLFMQQQQQQPSSKNHHHHHPLLHQKRTRPFPNVYETKHQSRHSSQIRADATMAQLHGPYIDLYAVDRTIDTARRNNITYQTVSMNNQQPREHCSLTEEVYSDVQSILSELYKVDKMVDRFKLGLQMPELLLDEEQDNVESTLRELRRMDLWKDYHEQQLPSSLKSNKDIKKTTVRRKNREQYCQFDLDDCPIETNEEYNMENDDKGCALDVPKFHEDNYIDASNDDLYSLKPDPYQFHDPYEMDGMIPIHSHHRQEDDLRQVLDLLRTDVEIDGASRHVKEMNSVQSLLEVDRSINKMKEGANKRRCERELLELYRVDVEMNNAKCRMTATSGVPSDCSIITGHQKKRSIFTEREKTQQHM